MADEKYVHIGRPADKCIEECSELIKTITKARRFGLDNFHPDRPDSSNRIEIYKEIEDVRRSLIALEEWLKTAPFETIAKGKW